jgi:hypothetical protein
MEHLKQLNESYWQHMRVATRIAFAGLQVFVLGMIHAVFPFLFKETVGWIIIDWFYFIRGRRHGRFDTLRCDKCGTALDEHINKNVGRIVEFGDDERRVNASLET